MKIKIKKYKFAKPYDRTGKTNFKFTDGKAGIYIIKENLKVVYVGHSQTNLYKTLYRHFQQWTAQQYVTSYAARIKRNSYLISVLLTTPAAAPRIEKYFVLQHNPRDNKAKYNLFNQPEIKNEKDEFFKQFREIEAQDLPF